MSKDQVKDSERTWLVKSSTRILGPFTLAELRDQLKSQQISILDEISQPEGRWGHVRDNKILMEIVKNIREELEAQPEKTMTGPTTSQTSSLTDPIVLNDNYNLIPDSEETPPPEISSNLKDVTPTNESTLANKRNSALTTSGVRNYGVEKDQRIQLRLQEKMNFWRWSIIAASCVAAWFIAVMLLGKSKTRNLSAEDLKKEAIVYKTVGLYQKSYESYLKYSKIKNPDFEFQKAMAPILISEGRQSVQGRRILEKSLTEAMVNTTNRVDAYLGIAVSYMLDGDLKQADNFLQKVLGYEPFNFFALLNVGVAHFKAGKFQTAFNDFDNLVKKNPQAHLAIFGKALAAIEMYKLKPDHLLLENILRDMRSSIDKSGYLRQEMLMIQAYALHLLNDNAGFSGAVLELLEEPNQTKDFSHPLYVDWRFTQWDYFESYCLNIFDSRARSALLKSLRAVCLMETNRDLEAENLIKEAVLEAPQEVHVLLTQATFLIKTGRFPEAKAILNMPELATYPMKNYLLGDICIKTKDLTCAQDSYEQLSRASNYSESSHFGLAWIAKQKGDRAKALDNVNVGLRSIGASTYLPLLELREQLESN